MRHSKNKIIVLILGVLVSFVALEVSLRAVGIIYSYWVPENRVAQKEPGAFVVLCVGDSYTVGSGAPANRGYPPQLEELLQEKYPEKKIQVVNRGAGASNTTMIFEKFDAYIDAIRPDVVIILAGGANNWNAYGYGNYLKRNGLANRLCDFFYSIKTFKLVKLFAYGIKNKNELPKEDRREMKIPSEAVEWNNKGMICEREGKYDEAIQYFKKALEIEPSSPGTREALAKIYSRIGSGEESRRIYRKLIMENPKNYKYFSAFAANFIQSTHTAEEREDIQFIREFARTDPVVEDILMSATDRAAYQREVGAWVSHDVEAMIQRAQKRGVKVIVQNYPRYYARFEYIDDGLKKAAQKNAVLFVDNKQIFGQIFSKGERKDDYYAFDKEHCNEKGYGVMARNIYDCIVTHHMVESL